MAQAEKAEKVVGLIEKELKELAFFIHENPELGLEERKAQAAQTELLKKYGFTVETGLCNFETSYKAVYKGAKPGVKIGMLAEYDALPELGHACGHNLIAMVGVGAGIAIRNLVDEYGGEICVFGTPAEETMGAKVEMSRQGVFDGLDVVMMSHPMHINSDCMNTMALKGIRLKYYGKTAHAAAAPYEGVNALDAAINFFVSVNALRQQTRSDARLHGIIGNGGTAANVIPDYTEILYCIRANKIAYLQELYEKVIDCAKAAALSTGCRMEYEKADEDFKDTNSNLTLGELNSQQMEKLGVHVVRTGGEVMPGSSDLGDVSYVCPAIQSTFDICGGRKIGAHTAEFAERAGAEESADAALTCVKGFFMTAEELMTNPEHLKNIKEEFRKNVLGE